MLKNFKKKILFVVIPFLLFSKSAISSELPLVQFNRELGIDDSVRNAKDSPPTPSMNSQDVKHTSSSIYKRRLGENLGQIMSDYKNDEFFQRNFKLNKVQIVKNYKILSFYNQKYNGMELSYIFNKNEQCIGYYLDEEGFNITHFSNDLIILKMKSLPKINNYIQSLNLPNDINLSFYVQKHNNFIEQYVISDVNFYHSYSNKYFIRNYLLLDAFYPNELESFFKDKFRDRFNQTNSQ